MKGLGPKWQAMTEAEKAPYVSQHTKAMDEYNKAIAMIDPKVRKSKPVQDKPFHRRNSAHCKWCLYTEIWQITQVLKALNEARAAAIKGKKVNKAKTNVNRVVKESGMPRPPATAYFMYANEINNSGRFSHMTVTERAKTVGALWRNMSQSEKARL